MDQNNTGASNPQRAEMQAADMQSAEKRAKRFYISLVLFLFLIQSVIMGSVIHLAIGDPAFAVVPNYHKEALRWDESRKAALAADRLGWMIELKPSDIADQRGMRALELSIDDTREDATLDQLTITGKLYHHAHADEAVEVTFNYAERGRYIVLAPAAAAGLWQLELSIEGGPEPMTQSMTFQIEAD
ncbi:FixH family protein [Roseiconus lacunae]|uniref:FixH family protein n=1 Tax=Roseiconus lacunae TaxID=2605694 RepID=UPI0011F36396|nr:FixH family protein [Roseiconus lacunae]WRQ53261.1 FixH family protein [Stieleria sp. HD01]